jgi:hypothetical protein
VWKQGVQNEGFIGLMMNTSDRSVHWRMWVEKKADSSGSLNLVWIAENKEHPVRKVEI